VGLRIIAGTARGRRLFTPPTAGGRPSIRPTADRAREALFNILGPLVLQARGLDLFAGTGALGLEALSRGAESVLLVDEQVMALELIRRNIAACGFTAQARIVRRDLRKGLGFLTALAPAAGFSLIFVDPPYDQGLGELVLRALPATNSLAAGAIVVVEDRAGATLPTTVDELRLYDQRRYGDTGFWLYQLTEP